MAVSKQAVQLTECIWCPPKETKPVIPWSKFISSQISDYFDFWLVYFPKNFHCMVNYILDQNDFEFKDCKLIVIQTLLTVSLMIKNCKKKKGQKPSRFEAVGKIVHYDHLKVDKNYRQVLKFKSFCSVSEKLKTFFSSFGALRGKEKRCNNLYISLLL